MLKKVLIASLFTLMLCLPTLAQDETPATPPEDIAAELDNVLNMIVEGISSIPGAPAGALLVRSPDWEYSNAAGFTALDSDEAVEPNTPFQIGSNTKMMTSTLILQLHEAGELDIEAPISTYLPEIAPRIPNGEDMTVRHLLQHRAGIWDYVDGTKDPETNASLGDGLFYSALDSDEALRQQYEPQELIDFAIENGTPLFEPGSTTENGQPNFSYCNTCYVLLGMIIEAVTGESYAENLQAHIFEPLGMSDTYLVEGVPEEGSTPRGYLEGEDVTDFNLSMAWSAGAVVSTPQDMATYITALLNGELYEDPATLELMLADPVINAPTGGNYALGIQDKGFGAGVWGHGGQTLAFESDIAYDTERNMVIVAWGNASSNPAGFASGLVTNVFSQAQALEDAPTLEEIVGQTLTLSAYFDAEASELISADEIERAESFTLTLDADGNISWQADCNRGTATYTEDEDNALSVELGISTLVACPPGSFADTFLANLGAVTRYALITDGEGGYQLVVYTTDNNSLSLAS